MPRPTYCDTCPDIRSDICPLPSVATRLAEIALDTIGPISAADIVMAAGHYIPSEAVALANDDADTPSESFRQKRAARVSDCVDMHESLGPIIGSA